jgi:hypothetical protein
VWQSSCREQNSSKIGVYAAPQALFLINNPFVLDQARALTERAFSQALPFRDKVYYKRLIKVWTRNLHEPVVGGVLEVGVTPGGVIERDNEAIGESLLKVFGADISSGLDAADRLDFVLQIVKGRSDPFDVGVACARLEFEQNDVPQLARRPFGVVLHADAAPYGNAAHGK